MRWLYALVLTVGLAMLFGIDAWSHQLTEENERARAFILSDAFWLTLGGGIAAAVASMGSLFLLCLFVPSRSGRNVPERGE
ncbi:hypothetical protein [Novosphingobium resinovorum]|uniref:Uncharacterized protein n=1 Tax=Novosphingobium resinovorum TaxID=158500 RepID=A0A1D8A509_9SPHN|nr:hypothetical protein [Novosphingobium resinovorum]AOR77194.1 hypothetical protein BES08_10865 [Novosphingobium resinovorum]